MPTEPVRIVFNNLPYLVIRSDEGDIERAYGPFTPGTEPNLADCTPDTEVSDGALLADLRDLLPISPTLPTKEDTLARGAYVEKRARSS